MFFFCLLPYSDFMYTNAVEPDNAVELACDRFPEISHLYGWSHANYTAFSGSAASVVVRSDNEARNTFLKFLVLFFR